MSRKRGGYIGIGKVDYGDNVPAVTLPFSTMAEELANTLAG